MKMNFKRQDKEGIAGENIFSAKPIKQVFEMRYLKYIKDYSEIPYKNKQVKNP